MLLLSTLFIENLKLMVQLQIIDRNISIFYINVEFVDWTEKTTFITETFDS